MGLRKGCTSCVCACPPPPQKSACTPRLEFHSVCRSDGACMTMADSTEALVLALENALEADDDAQIRTAYTNLGLANYAHKRFAEAVDCFEDQIQFITSRKPLHLLKEGELTSLSFAYRLLALLYSEQVAPMSPSYAGPYVVPSTAH